MQKAFQTFGIQNVPAIVIVDGKVKLLASYSNRRKTVFSGRNAERIFQTFDESNQKRTRFQFANCRFCHAQNSRSQIRKNRKGKMNLSRAGMWPISWTFKFRRKQIWLSHCLKPILAKFNWPTYWSLSQHRLTPAVKVTNKLAAVFKLKARSEASRQNILNFDFWRETLLSDFSFALLSHF